MPLTIVYSSSKVFDRYNVTTKKRQFKDYFFMQNKADNFTPFDKPSLKERNSGSQSKSFRPLLEPILNNIYRKKYLASKLEAVVNNGTLETEEIFIAIK